MYNEQLEKLMEIALLDGELSEKEKQILFKKAESFGVDLDEFEMVLNSRLFETKKVNSVTTKPVTEKHGNLSKCPACGALVPSFSLKCPDCSYVFKNINANDSLKEFSDKLENILSDKLSINKTENYINAIRNFPIPHSFENLYEFLIYVGNKSNSKVESFMVWGDNRKVQNAWDTKFREIITKSEFIFRDDAKSLEMIKKVIKDLTKKPSLGKRFLALSWWGKALTIASLYILLRIVVGIVQVILY